MSDIYHWGRGLDQVLGLPGVSREKGFHLPGPKSRKRRVGPSDWDQVGLGPRAWHSPKLKAFFSRKAFMSLPNL